MTTTAQAVPALEVSAPDDNMDVLSDTGFDFGDGDIDLDLDTAPSVHDEDMSLNDAATDGGVDMEEPSADQDDYMADHGDLIEDDDLYNDGGAAVVSQVLDESVPIFEADMLAPPDEDLIDYSDDEVQQQIKMHSPAGHEEQEAHSPPDAEATFVPVEHQSQNESAEGDAKRVESSEVVSNEAQTPENDNPDDLEKTEVSHGYQAADAGPQREDLDEDFVHAHDGGVRLGTDEHSSPGNDDDAQDDTVAEHQEEPQRDAVYASESEERDDQQMELRPVTVNYAGNELWLFKQHDLDESGDFLLEDLSVAKSSVSDLFRVCRLSLGDDVSGEHEIGFRFDHLHNLELYEDNTACVAVSLERLVNLYHTLQAQDGNEDPECFYVTLQFRPRFATLLADVAQYAEQGSGYSALDAAVAAGETHFSNVFSSVSTEHDHVEWDDENDDDDTSSPISVRSTAPDEADAGEHHEQQDEEARAQGQEEEEEDSEEQQQGINLNEDWSQTLGKQDGEPHLAQETVSSVSPHNAAVEAPTDHTERVHEHELAADQRHDSESQDDRTPDQIAHDKQEADDFVDYSDDEDDNGQDVKSVLAQEPSPSSSTVRGDDPTETSEFGIALEPEDQNGDNAVQAGSDDNDDDATLLTQTHYGDDVNHYAFQDYGETYENGDPFQDYQAEGTAGDSFNANSAYNGDANQEFADYNFQDLDADVNLGFDEQPLDELSRNDQGDETFEVIEDATHADTFLDLDNAPAWAVDADPATDLPGEDAVVLHDDISTYADNEGGAVEQPLATSSSATDTALTLTNDTGTLSPQGQKRSIDEVGDGIEGVPDPADAKRLKL